MSVDYDKKYIESKKKYKKYQIPKENKIYKKYIS
jgi:hypothetical protein